MLGGKRWRAAILTMTIGLVLPAFGHYLPPAVVAEAANLSLPLQSSEARKGFVTARTSASMTVLEGRTSIQVVVTEKTEIAGQRKSFADVAIGDVVRVEGSMTADKHLLAHRVEVILAAASIPAGSPPRTRGVNSWISVILNGGITVPLP